MRQINEEFDNQAMGDEQAITVDTLFSGALSCRQFRNGYRFSVDSVLAAHFHQPKAGETILDLGAGCGVISLIMMYRWGPRIAHLRALEYQTQLCRLIDENFAASGFSEKCGRIQGDVKNITTSVSPESFSLVICNPPYYPAASGRLSKGNECAVARHLVLAGLDDFTRAAATAVINGGTVVFVYPAERFSQLHCALQKSNLEPKELQMVYSYPQPAGDARLVLVKCIKNGGTGMRVLPPFYVYLSPGGDFSKEMKQLYTP